jgi:quinol-cytochrome oxidoreductase complex cytochrome b subunit
MQNKLPDSSKSKTDSPKLSRRDIIIILFVIFIIGGFGGGILGVIHNLREHGVVRS